MKRPIIRLTLALIMLAHMPTRLINAQDTIVIKEIQVNISRNKSRPTTLTSPARTITANRPQGWMPPARILSSKKMTTTNPPIIIHWKDILRQAQKSPSSLPAGLKAKNPKETASNLNKVFSGGIAGIIPLMVLNGCSIGDCPAPQLTLYNNTFEPITVYAYDEHDGSQGALVAAKLNPADSVTLIFDYAGYWGTAIYGEHTQSWLGDSGLIYFDCAQNDNWLIEDPFAAVDIINNVDFDLAFCIDDYSCRNSYLIPQRTILEFYFYPADYEFTLRDARNGALYFDERLSVFANEITALEITYW